MAEQKQRMWDEYYVRVAIKSRDGKSTPKVKELSELRLEVSEASSFLLGKLGRGRIVVLIEVWVALRYVRIFMCILCSRPNGGWRPRSEFI